jgi:hypothetical protein
MPWAIIIPLLVQYGIPFVQDLIKRATSGKDATPEDFVALAKLASDTPQNHLDNVQASLGLPKDDPRIVALQQLIK